jgi:hypothetical protein
VPALAFVISILSRATSRIYIRIPFILIPLLQMLFWIKEIWPPFKNVLDLPPLLFVQTILAMRFISDFDTKLIGGHACEYLNSLLIHVNAAPAHRQDKYGLAECHWQTIIAMARNWLASAELPGSSGSLLSNVLLRSAITFHLNYPVVPGLLHLNWLIR